MVGHIWISGFWSDIVFIIKILCFLVTRLSEVIGHNVQAVSEFYTYTEKMPGKCPVSDCYLELSALDSPVSDCYLELSALDSPVSDCYLELSALDSPVSDCYLELSALDSPVSDCYLIVWWSVFVVDYCKSTNIDGLNC